MLMIAFLMALLTPASQPTASKAPEIMSKAPHTKLAYATCYKVREEIRGNMKVCYYSCGGATFYRTAALTDTCPMSITQ